MITLTKLGDVADITSSKRIYASEYLAEGVPFWRGKEVVEMFSTGETRSDLYIAPGRFSEIEGRFGAPQAGDLLLTSVGTLGVPYLVPENQTFYFKDGNLIWFRNLRGVLGQYLYYWLQSKHGKAELAKCTIGTSQQAFTIEKLKGASVGLHPLEEQGRIASTIGSYDALIKNNRRRIKLLEEAAQLIYREWFVRLRFPGHEHTKIENGVPEGWNKRKIGDYSPFAYGKALKEDNRVPGPFPVFGSSGQVGTHEKALVAGPGIIIGRKGNVGAVYWSDADFFPIDTTYYIDSARASLFLFHALSDVPFINTDVAVPGLNRDMAHSREIVIPCEAVLKEFEDQASTIQRQVRILKAQVFKLQEARDLLLPRLMSGEIEV